MMTRIIFLAILFVYNVLLTSAQVHENSNSEAKLLFEDNFEGRRLDLKKWEYRQLNKKRFDSFLTTRSVEVSKGKLVLTVFSEPAGDGFKHYSGMVSTDKKFSQKYGYFEARIKFSTIPGMWSAFWVQSPNVTNTSLSAEEAGVEIDVVEHRVKDIKGNNIPNLLAHTLHWGGYQKPNHKEKRYRKDKMIDNPNEFNLYAVEWTADKYTFYLNGKETQTWTRADNVPISQVPQFIILSTEVRDNNWAGNIPKSGFDNLFSSKAFIEIDWVRVYDKNPYLK